MDQEIEPKRKPGTFLPGHDPRRAPPEKRRGTHNKITVLLKRGIVAAARKHGRDGNGAGGVDGYFEFLAARHPKIYAGLLGRLLPLHIKAEDTAPGAGVNRAFTINIVGIESGRYLSPEEFAAARLAELPPMIQHAPAVDDNDDEPPQS